MTDFLTRLAQRAVSGGAGRIEPVREPVFPADLPDGDVPAITPQMVAGTADAGQQQRARITASPVPKPRATEPDQPAGGVRRVHAPPATDEPIAPRAGPEWNRQSTSFSPARAEAADVQPPLMPAPVSRSDQNRKPLDAPDPDPLIASPEAITGTPGRSKAPPGRSLEPKSVSPLSPSLRPPPEQKPEAPAPVTVRIGRIEVRANVAPSAPAPAQRKPERTPALSLEEYLARRTGGWQ